MREMDMDFLENSKDTSDMIVHLFFVLIMCCSIDINFSHSLYQQLLFVTQCYM